MTNPRKSDKLSRPERRSAKRLAVAISAYHLGVANDNKDGGRGFRVPGSQKHW